MNPSAVPNYLQGDPQRLKVKRLDCTDFMVGPLLGKLIMENHTKKETT